MSESVKMEFRKSDSICRAEEVMRRNGRWFGAGLEDLIRGFWVVREVELRRCSRGRIIC